MSPSSFSVVAFLSLCALGGCYDLSAPSGPTAEDFENQNVTAAKEPGTAPAEPAAANCPSGACKDGEPVTALLTARPAAPAVPAANALRHDSQDAEDVTETAKSP